MNQESKVEVTRIAIWVLSLIMTFIGGYYSDRAFSSDARARDLSRLEAQAERLKSVEERLTRIEGKMDQLIMQERRR